MKSTIMQSGKFLPIYEYCKGKRVLDVGCAGDYTKLEDICNSLFCRLSEHADIYGIDINGDAIDYLTRIGFKCRLLNAAHIEELSESPFDVILLGDIIEHMPDPAIFLIKMRPFLKSDGFVICTTPNAMHYLNTLSMILHREVTRRQHAMWFCAVTMKNVFRFAGYALEQMYFINYWDSLREGGGSIRRLRLSLEKLLFWINPELAPTLLGVFRKDPLFDSKFLNNVYEERWHP
jgi:SAM-dependent methyltransferase